MDDDPETPLGSHETSEQNLDVGEQKHSVEIHGENTADMIQHQESGDTGPVMEQEALKKSISGVDVPEQTPQVESKTSIFRRKELLDEGQLSDVPGSVKSSATALRKPSPRSSQRLVGQESRRSSQQSIGQPPPLSQKPSRAQTLTEADAKDVTWVSKRTGKVMKCRSQQTSIIWEQKTLSDILHPSTEESDINRDEETDLTTAGEDNASSWETTEEQPPVDESQLSSQEPEEMSKHTRDGKEEGWESWGSQQSIEKLSMVSPKSSAVQPAREVETEEEVTWISRRSGREMKCKAQQTSMVWEPRILTEILHSSSQESHVSGDGEDYSGEPLETIDSCRDEDLEDELRISEESQPSIPQAESQPSPGEEFYPSGQPLEGEKSMEDFQQPEELQTEQERQGLKGKIDQAQQTDSAESLKKVLIDRSQQTDIVDGLKPASLAKLQESHHDIQQVDALESRRGSQEPQGSISQPTTLDAQKSSQQSLEPEPKVGDEKEAEPDQKPSLTAEAQQPCGSISDEENTWVSRKTGKLVRCQCQQTDRSWLQYCASKMQKLKKCSSQQTDESFLQRYAERLLKAAGREAPPSKAESEEHKHERPCSACGEIDTGFLHLIDIEELDLAMEEEVRRAEEQEPSSHGSEVGEAEKEQLSEQESQQESQQTDMPEPEKDSQLVDGQEPQRDVGQDSQEETARGQDQWPDESGSKTMPESLLSDDERQDTSQQAYSLISLEDGIWLNRKTGKLVISHTQQTSETRIPMALEDSMETAEEAHEPLGNGTGEASSYVEQPEGKGSQWEGEVDGQQLPVQESQDDSQSIQSPKASLTIAQSAGKEEQCADDVEKLLSSRLSEATLLSVENPDVEDEPTNMYTCISVEKGSWVNITTGKLLESQNQQTEESFCQEALPSGSTNQQSPEDGQLGAPDSSSGPPQQLEGEGLCDEPASESQEPNPVDGE